MHNTRLGPLPSAELVRGDVQTGAGLAEAVTGVDAVIHAATPPLRKVQATEVGGTRQMLGAAGSAGAQLIYPSIVGVDKISARYYRAKWQAEEIVESGSRWTIQRATQFHPLIDRMLISTTSSTAIAPGVIAPAQSKPGLGGAGPTGLGGP